MARISFPFWVFFNLQVWVQFTNGFETKSHVRTWPSSQLENLQYVSPRLKYIAEDNRKPGYLNDLTEMVSNFSLFLGNIYSIHRYSTIARVRVCVEFQTARVVQLAV